ncbi:MAG: hypothetical protein LUG99_15855 [Lachnospiraceae bacterium]|nr:hypothetical protein [Lachnospiraceae bacterium]
MSGNASEAKTTNVTASDVLNSLFAPDEKVCIRVFDDRKGGTFKGKKISCDCAKFSTVNEELKRHNAENRGIFYVVNYGGNDDASIIRINAQFVEMDEGSFDEQQMKVDGFPLPPSMIIRTQKSLLFTGSWTRPHALRDSGKFRSNWLSILTGIKCASMSLG